MSTFNIEEYGKNMSRERLLEIAGVMQKKVKRQILTEAQHPDAKEVNGRTYNTALITLARQIWAMAKESTRPADKGSVYDLAQTLQDDMNTRLTELLQELDDGNDITPRRY